MKTGKIPGTFLLQSGHEKFGNLWPQLIFQFDTVAPYSDVHIVGKYPIEFHS